MPAPGRGWAMGHNDLGQPGGTAMGTVRWRVAHNGFIKSERDAERGEENRQIMLLPSPPGSRPPPAIDGSSLVQQRVVLTLSRDHTGPLPDSRLSRPWAGRHVTHRTSLIFTANLQRWD